MINWRRLRTVILDRLSENSTWQAIAFIATLLGAHWGKDLDWGASAALGGTISALLKAALPDRWFETENE